MAIPVLDSEGAGTRLPADGDKTPPNLLLRTHVRHPGAPEAFTRSTLVVGSRGVGKTFLLRHRKHTTHKGAIYINLLKTLQSLSRDAGLGGRTLIYSETLGERIRSKTAALIGATCLLEGCTSGNTGSYDLSLLDAVLPHGLRARGEANPRTAQAIVTAVNELPLDAWPKSGSSALLSVVKDISDRQEEPLALFLDRAEDVPVPSMHLLTQLLDQSFEVLTVIAGRPGVAQLLPTDRDPTLVPGDHYDILHLGSEPYSEAWLTFADEAVRNFLASHNRSLADDLPLNWCVRMARDSLRDTVQLAQVAAGTPGEADLPERMRAVGAFRAQRLARARAALYPDNRDFEGFVREVQGMIGPRLASDSQFSVCVRFPGAETQLSLLDGPRRRSDVLLSAIRAEALYFPPGYEWHPFELPLEFELAPIFVWNTENARWIV